MTTERANILKLLNDRKANGQSITLAELTNATGIFQYRKLEKILEGLKHDGYLSRLIIRDLDEPITYELTERGCNYQQEIEDEKKLWWNNNKVGIWTVVLSIILAICAIVDSVIGVCTYLNCRGDYQNEKENLQNNCNYSEYYGCDKESV